MNVDGIGERNVVDSGGFPVVWLGGSDPIGQDPNQGGTNYYGPGDVLYDSDSGDAYQIGSDWHLRTMGGGGGDGGGQQQQAYVTDHFYYVDSGSIIEKTVYSDGNVTYADTGQSSSYGDGSAANDVASLASGPTNVQVDYGNSPGQTDPYNTQQPPADTGGGFQQPNDVGGYGPYATPDPPQFTDQGTYVDNGRLIHQQSDQYGNPYYTDLGPASSPAPAPRTVSATPRAAPAVPSTRAPRTVGGPAIYDGAGTSTPTTTYPANAPANEPRAADGKTLSGQNAITRATFGAVYGANAATEWVAQHNASIGAPAAAAATTTRTPTVSGSSQRQAAATTPSGRAATSSSSNNNAVAVQGNVGQWINQAGDWLTNSNKAMVKGLPNGFLVAGGALGFRMLRHSRRFR